MEQSSEFGTKLRFWVWKISFFWGGGLRGEEGFWCSETQDQVEHMIKSLTLGRPLQNGIGDESKMFAERVIQAARPTINHFLTAGERNDVRAKCHNTASEKQEVATFRRRLPPDSSGILCVLGLFGGLKAAEWNLLCIYRSHKVTLIAVVLEQRCSSWLPPVWHHTAAAVDLIRQELSQYSQTQTHTHIAMLAVVNMRGN